MSGTWKEHESDALSINNRPNLSPEQRFTYAIFIDGIKTAICDETQPRRRSGVDPAKRDIVAARYWLFEAHESESSFSWHFCCEALGMDADALREKIARLWQADPDTLRTLIDRLDAYYGHVINNRYHIVAPRQRRPPARRGYPLHGRVKDSDGPSVEMQAV